MSKAFGSGVSDALKVAQPRPKRKSRYLKPLLAAAVAAPVVGLMSTSASGVTLYWDSTGTTAGAGTAATGNWGTDAFWSTSSAGTVATANWTAGGDAIFS